MPRDRELLQFYGDDSISHSYKDPFMIPKKNTQLASKVSKLQIVACWLRLVQCGAPTIVVNGVTFPRHPVIFSDDDWGVQSPPQHSI